MFLKANKNQNNESNNYWSKLLKQEMVVIEVGSGYGDNIYQINKNLKRGSIYAIELDIKKFKVLKNNCLNWEMLSNNKIHLLQVAISDNNQDNGTYFVENTTNSYTLDTLFKILQPDIIKINITEEPLKILQGSREILKKGKSKFLITLNPDKSYEDIDNFMESFGYCAKNFYQMNLFINPHYHKWYDYIFKSLKKALKNITPVPFRYYYSRFYNRIR